MRHPASLASLFAALGVLTPACGTERASDASTDAGADATVLGKARTVTLELGEVVHRELVEDADGYFIEGEVTPLAGAEVCVTQRRDAFHNFEPFEDLPPTCETSAAGESVLLPGMPANSDLVITIAAEGYAPSLQPRRTDERDVPLPSWASGLITPLLLPDEADPWIEPEPARDESAGLVGVYAYMGWVGPYPQLPPGGYNPLATPPLVGIALAQGVDVHVESLDGEVSIDLVTMRERPRFLSLPAGTYRARFSHPSRDCVPAAIWTGLSPTLPTDRRDTIEVIVLAGHVTYAAFDCFCAPEREGQAVTDLPTCTLAAPDAGP